MMGYTNMKTTLLRTQDSMWAAIRCSSCTVCADWNFHVLALGDEDFYHIPLCISLASETALLGCYVGRWYLLSVSCSLTIVSGKRACVFSQWLVDSINLKDCIYPEFQRNGSNLISTCNRRYKKPLATCCGFTGALSAQLFFVGSRGELRENI